MVLSNGNKCHKYYLLSCSVFPTPPSLPCALCFSPFFLPLPFFPPPSCRPSTLVLFLAPTMATATQAMVPTLFHLHLPFRELGQKHCLEVWTKILLPLKFYNSFLWHQVIQSLWLKRLSGQLGYKKFGFGTWALNSFCSKSLSPVKLPRLGRTYISNGDFSYCSGGKKLRLISISPFSKEKDGCFHVLLFTYRV